MRVGLHAWPVVGVMSPQGAYALWEDNRVQQPQPIAPAAGSARRREGSSGRIRCWLAVLVLLAGVVGVYANSFRGQFVFDDIKAIERNPHIRSLWPPTQWFRSDPDVTTAGRPVVSLSLAINYRISGLKPWSYHLVNLLIHAGCVLCLFGLVRRTLIADAMSGPLRVHATALAFASALLWAVHPLNTSAVTYVVQRAESLMALWYLLTLYLAARAMNAQHPARWWIGATVACALGMATKEVMVSAPLMVLLYARAYQFTSWGETWKRIGRGWTALAGTWLIFGGLLATGPRSETAGFTGPGIGAVEYLRTQCEVIVHYLRLLFWPDDLVLDYLWPIAPGWGAVWPETVLVGLLAAGAVWAFLRVPALGFPAVLCFAVLAPSSSFLPLVDPAFEHRMYLPSAAVVVLVVVGGFLAGRWLLVRLGSESRGRLAVSALGWGLVAALAGVLGARTILRNRQYESVAGIWEATARSRPANSRAFMNWGWALTEIEDRPHDAIGVLYRARDLNPTHVPTRIHLGNALSLAGLHEQAATEFAQGVRLDPSYLNARLGLGVSLVRLGRYREAREHLRYVLQRQPGHPGARKFLRIANSHSADEPMVE